MQAGLAPTRLVARHGRCRREAPGPGDVSRRTGKQKVPGLLHVFASQSPLLSRVSWYSRVLSFRSFERLMQAPRGCEVPLAASKMHLAERGVFSSGPSLFSARGGWLTGLAHRRRSGTPGPPGLVRPGAFTSLEVKTRKSPSAEEMPPLWAV